MRQSVYGYCPLAKVRESVGTADSAGTIGSPRSPRLRHQSDCTTASPAQSEASQLMCNFRFKINKEAQPAKNWAHFPDSK